jgi:hypothetical protein
MPRKANSVGGINVTRTKAALQAFVLAASCLFANGALAGDKTFSGLHGAWRGTGSVALESGNAERLKCKGYYNAKSDGSLGMAIRCGSAAFKINMRAKLEKAGDKISGTWEEREFNQSGDLSGATKSGGFKLNFTGAIEGSITVAMDGKRQTVHIATTGAGFSGVKLTFARSG